MTLSFSSMSWDLSFGRRTNPRKSGKDVSEEERQRAQNAYRLLRSWQDVPGRREDQTVDEKTLLAWVQKARSMAEDAACWKSVIRGSERYSLTTPEKTMAPGPASR